jgi:hypothetical protein
MELSEIENRIITEYRKRLSCGVPSHTMGVVDCPDCLIPMGLHSYHCNCCGWHDDDKKKEMFALWNKRAEEIHRERDAEHVDKV